MTRAEALADLRSDLKLLHWMVGTNILLTVGVLGRLLFIR